ncbi:MAG: hypothetical protein L3K24_12135 [Gammaproteobacteria bacterium]|nr:hypothetical protein [Gammaproteobacteria bacterium]
MARKKKYDYCDDAFKATGDGRYNICYGRPREIVMMKNRAGFLLNLGYQF